MHQLPSGCSQTVKSGCIQEPKSQVPNDSWSIFSRSFRVLVNNRTVKGGLPNCMFSSSLKRILHYIIDMQCLLPQTHTHWKIRYQSSTKKGSPFCGDSHHKYYILWLSPQCGSSHDIWWCSFSSTVFLSFWNNLWSCQWFVTLQRVGLQRGEIAMSRTDSSTMLSSW